MFKRPKALIAIPIVVLAGLFGCVAEPGAPAITGVSSAAETYLSLVVAPPTAGGTVTQVIGSKGGMLKVGNHALVVPRNAVSSNTEFTMTVVAGVNIVVELSARRVSDGATVSSFSTPLTLRLSYADAGVPDPSRLLNGYLPDAVTLIPIPSSLSTVTQTINSPIYHFSDYGMLTD